MNNHRWNLMPPAPPQFIKKADGIPPLLIQLLYNRGITNPTHIDSFLSDNVQPSPDPFLMPDMDKATTRIYRAILRGEKIAVYGDFDVDGITATAILVQGIEGLGGNALPYIPHRLTEGYGLKMPALEKLKKQGAELVISVDCGITAVAETAQAQEMGLDVIITDHHTPLPEIPPAAAVIDPKLPESRYPCVDLSGAGVALKLLQALLKGTGKGEDIEGYMDLAALGTIADMSPLLGENRQMVKQGLRVINSHPRPGIEALMNQVGLERGKIDSRTISWKLAPRLNAAGRVAHASQSYKLLVTQSSQEARDLSIELEERNVERQNMTTSCLSRAREQVLAEGVAPLIAICGEEYPVGIAGLVAGRIAEEFYRPSMVVRTEDDTSCGSCRSIAEFNIMQALTHCADLMTYYGGHAQAAGFTLPTANLPILTTRLLEMATAELKDMKLIPQVNVDAEVTLPQMGKDTYSSIKRLAPFGCDNPTPIFLSRGVDVCDLKTMGGNGEHLRMKLKQDGTTWDGVGFRMGDRLEELGPALDIVYHLEMDTWRGADRLRLKLIDLKTAEPPGASL